MGPLIRCVIISVIWQPYTNLDIHSILYINVHITDDREKRVNQMENDMFKNMQDSREKAKKNIMESFDQKTTGSLRLSRDTISKDKPEDNNNTIIKSNNNTITTVKDGGKTTTTTTKSIKEGDGMKMVTQTTVSKTEGKFWFCFNVIF